MSTSIRVLVVDDEPVLRDLITQILIRRGYTVISVFDGQAVLDLFENDQDFSSVVTDLYMPKMDGLAILQYIKQCCPLIPVIISSVAHNMILVKHILEQDAAAFLPRPFSPKQLLELITKVLDKN